MERPRGGGSPGRDRVEITRERGGSKANEGEWREDVAKDGGLACVSLSRSKLRLTCNQKKIIISSHQLSLFWPLFVNERFMVREGESGQWKKG